MTATTSNLAPPSTTVTTTVRYASREVRDGVLKSPMESGVAQSYDKLAELLASTAARKGK